MEQVVEAKPDNSTRHVVVNANGGQAKKASARRNMILAAEVVIQALCLGRPFRRECVLETTADRIPGAPPCTSPRITYIALITVPHFCIGQAAGRVHKGAVKRVA